MSKHNGPYARPVVERFMDHVCPEPNTGCWLWTSSTHIFGYGKFGIGSLKDGSRTVRDAHRVSWELFVGPIGDSAIHVCHKCDVPQCVNPDHLFLGTLKENMLDMRMKGRAARKLTIDQVRRIKERRATGETLVSIAKDFGIHHTMVSFIARGVSWRHS